MKRILVFSLVALLVLMTGVGYAAESRIGKTFRQSVTIYDASGAHVHVSSSPVDVYRVTLTADSTSTFVQLIDSASMGSHSTMEAYISSKCAPASFGANASGALMIRNVKADITVGTASQTLVIDFEDGLRCEQGLLAGFAGPGSANGAFATIEYATAVN